MAWQVTARWGCADAEVIAEFDTREEAEFEADIGNREADMDGLSVIYEAKEKKDDA